MKKNIHPDYHEINVVMTDGTKYKTRSTMGTSGETLKLDIDPKSHPAWVGGSQKILDKGILLTEYTFGLKAEKFRLIERDRIQAMLANDIVLIESDIKGGSMHAIKWAKKLNKRIWCFDMNASGNKERLNNYDDVIKFSNIEEFINKFNVNS